MNVVSKALLYM